MSEGFLILSGDRVPELAAISTPSFDVGKKLVGAVTLSMPKERLGPDHLQHVLQASHAIMHEPGSG